MLAVAVAALACTPGTASIDRAVDEGVVRTSVVTCDARRRQRVVRRAVARNGTGIVLQDADLSDRSVVWSEVATRSGRRVARVVTYDLSTRRVRSRRVVAVSAERLSVPVGTTAEGTIAWHVDKRGVDVMAFLRRGARLPALVAREPGLRDMAVHYGATLVWKDGSGGQRYRDLRRSPKAGCAARKDEVVTLDTPGVLLTANGPGRTAHAACLKDTGVKLGIYVTPTGTAVTPAGVDRHWVILTEARPGACSGESVVVIDLRQGGRYLGTRRDACDGPRAGQPVSVDEAGPVLRWTRDGVDHNAPL